MPKKYEAKTSLGKSFIRSVQQVRNSNSVTTIKGFSSSRAEVNTIPGNKNLSLGKSHFYTEKIHCMCTCEWIMPVFLGAYRAFISRRGNVIKANLWPKAENVLLDGKIKQSSVMYNILNWITALASKLKDTSTSVIRRSLKGHRQILSIEIGDTSSKTDQTWKSEFSLTL